MQSAKPWLLRTELASDTCVLQDAFVYFLNLATNNDVTVGYSGLPQASCRHQHRCGDASFSGGDRGVDVVRVFLIAIHRAFRDDPVCGDFQDHRGTDTLDTFKVDGRIVQFRD